jgi:Domain of unknown function (DUF4338)
MLGMTERTQRSLAVGRKNFYGSGAEWIGDGRLLAALGFGASAWQLKPRDQYIGWDDGQRRRGLPRIVNNARFLILPWVNSPWIWASAWHRPLRARGPPQNRATPRFLPVGNWSG